MAAFQLLDLPPELIEYVISFLSGKEIVRLRLVNRLLNDIAMLDSVWQRKCLEEYEFSDISGWKISSFYEFYKKVLYTYGHLIGLWQSESPPYGGLIHVKFTTNRICGIEYLAPVFPQITSPLRSKLSFTIELDEKGEVQTLCHKGPSNYPHNCMLTQPTEENNRANYTCSLPIVHRNPGGVRREFEQFVMDESYSSEDFVVQQHELLLIKFKWMKQYESNFDLNPLILPSPKPNVIIHPGLFKGTYSSHGLELILVTYEDQVEEMRGMKITGDPNVPAGNISICGCLTKPLVLSLEQQMTFEALKNCGSKSIPDRVESLFEQPFALPADCICHIRKLPDTCKARFEGFVNTAESGYKNNSMMPAHLVIFDENSFGMLVPKLRSFMMCSRVLEDLS